VSTDRGKANHLLGDRTQQQTLDPFSTVRTDHDQIRADIAGQLNDFALRRTLANVTDDASLSVGERACQFQQLPTDTLDVIDRLRHTDHRGRAHRSGGHRKDMHEVEARDWEHESEFDATFIARSAFSEKSMATRITDRRLPLDP